MFTKKQKVGEGRYEVTKTVTDWDAVFVAIFWALVAIFILKACS